MDMPYLIRLGLLSSAILVQSVASVHAQSDSSAKDVEALKLKFKAEREESVKVKYPPSIFNRADELAKRGDAALQAGNIALAVRQYRDARWQLPFLPAGLPDHVVRVFG